MGHSRNHWNGRNSSYLEQYCAIGASGSLGVVAVMLYSNDHSYIVWGGAVILSLAILRSLLLLLSIGHNSYHRQGHLFNPWRYVVLSFPIFLYFLGPSITSAKSDDLPLAADQNVLHISCEDLEDWAKDESKREWSEGRTVVVIGILLGGKSGRKFGLLDPKAEHNAVRATVFCEEEVADTKLGLVQVTGELRYRKQNADDYGEYRAVLKVRSQDDIIPIKRVDQP